MDNGVMMQYFEFNLKSEDHLWQKVYQEAGHLEQIGITAVWLPPAFKGAMGKNDSGYGVYDLYDLGEFDQKWTIATKYGTKDEYLAAIEQLHRCHIDVYPDIVLNHKMGADNVNLVIGHSVSSTDRLKKTGRERKLLVPTQFNFYRRNKKYSAFQWTADHFNGVDYDLKTHQRKIFLINGKEWSPNVDKENGNFDYLMGANIDLNQKDVIEELRHFGYWYCQTTHLDGFRLDALKHMDDRFYDQWLSDMRQLRPDYFAVGEYWHGDVAVLMQYLKNVHFQMSLFDIPLHYHFYDCSVNWQTYDLRALFERTLMQWHPTHAVTFVDNHDTQPGQALTSFVRPWFKPLAYACILLREAGYPCVFYGDYYGLVKGRYRGIRDILEKLLFLRKHYALGAEYDYFEDDYQLGWTREGGLACLMAIRQKGEKKMYVGRQYSGQKFQDVFHPRRQALIDEEGWGVFRTGKNQLSVYIPQRI